MSKKNDQSSFFQTSTYSKKSAQGRLSRHQNKKSKRSHQEKDHKQLIEYIDKYQGWPLQSIYKSQKQSMPGHYQLGIWRKKMGLLLRSHLPTYVKLLDYGQVNEPCFTPSRANINPKRNNKSDMLIQDPQTQKTRLIKMETFPILLSPFELVFYKVSFLQFKKIFQCSEFSIEDLKRVYNYCVEQCESIIGTNKYLLWPAVLLQGLNYKFEEIKQFVENFKISNSENIRLIQNILKVINQFSISQVFSQSNIRIDAPENEQKQKNDGQKQFSGHEQVINQNKEVFQQAQIEQEEREQQVVHTQMNFCVWLVGTAKFAFTNHNILNWNYLTHENIKNLFTTTIFSSSIKQMNQIIDSLNKHKKLREAQLKSDEFRNFLNRICIYKTETQEQMLCIPLRFEIVKGVGKKILIKLLKSEETELKWVPTQSTTVNYTVPQISKKQMIFFYLSQKISPLDIVTSYLYREFLFLPQKQTSEVFLSLYPQFIVRQEQARKQRCVNCNYIIRQMPFKRCFFCKNFCHQQCSLQYRKRLTSGFPEEVFGGSLHIPYICQKCQPCIICLQAVRNDFLFCSNCFSYTHFQCGRIKGLQQNQSNMHYLKINDKYVCESCLKCKMCSHKLKDSEYLIMDNQFFCSQCSDKIKSNNHCHVCMKKKEGNSTMKWIQCGDPLCQKWVHQICDPEYISVVKSPSAADPYLCPFCRLVQRRKIYIQIINSLIVFDEAQFFTQPTYKTIPFYDALISDPICFSDMKQKASQGKYDENPYKKIQSDFQLIVKNARRFNMPKDTAHVQAKILKILGQKALQKFRPLFSPQIRSLISGIPFEQIKNLRLQLHREINNHYPQILLNYKAQKSFIEVRQNKKKGPEQQLRPEDQVKFNSLFILNNFFRNSSILFHLKKQKIGIVNLFTMPKNENQRGIWHSIKGDLCYYHNNNEIVYSCNECCESYCCMKECIRHRVCTACGQKGCKCDCYQCGCTPLKQKQRKLIETKLFQKYMQPPKTHRQVLMQITQNFKYCLKCAQDKLIYRICTACQGICSWGYFKCPSCQKVWHKKCYPHLLSINYASYITQLPVRQQPYGLTDQLSLASNYNLNPFYSYNRPSYNNVKQVPTNTCSFAYCKECFNSFYPNNYQQALTLESKGKLVKIAKITRYMRIFVEVYFNEGIRLTPYQIQQLILDNYDQFSVREQLFKEYELNYSIIERFRDFTFKINAAIQRSCAEYLNDYSQIKKKNLIFDENVIKGFSEQLQENTIDLHYLKLVDSYEYLIRCKKIWWKYFRFNSYNQDWKPIRFWEQSPSFDLQFSDRRLKIEKISEVRQKIIYQAYTYKDYNTYHLQILKNADNIIECLKPHPDQIVNQEQTFQDKVHYRNYLQSLKYISTIDESYYKKLHHYRFSLIYHPRAMPFEYKLNATFKKKSNLQQATKQFLLGIYEQSKNCLRNGSTCLLKQTSCHKESKQYWSVLKRWGGGKRQMHITLKKRNQRWVLKIDNGYERIVSEIQEIICEINRKNPQVKITSFKQLGQFLGFTIFQPFYKANHFTNFLQTNLVDEMPLLDKMNRITELYESFSWGDNGIFEKSGPYMPYNSISLSQSGTTQKRISYQYSMNRVKPQYLSKKPKKTVDKGPKRMEKRISNPIGEMDGQNHQSQEAQQVYPFISFEDLKRYLSDFSIPIQTKVQISLKNCQTLNEVFIAPSKIHKLGLFSRKNIKKHSIVIEYIGEIVSQSVADLRQKKFHYGCYLFGILKEAYKQNQDKKDIIDATFRGNMARYLNHSCDPNCKAKTEYVNNSPRIIIYTIRDIAQFEQLTYDYQFNVDAVEKLECTCRAKNCQGRLN